ncbi:MAG: Multidrug export protein EmrA [Firmicutes bacterium ADurb.Bin456]|nr:MAG: Multidrug export protein EmrA [Firmicutes bacterium ADurb.Bin456]
MAAGAFAELDRKRIVISFLFLAVTGLAVLLFLNHYRHHSLILEEQENLTATGTVEAKSVLASFKVAGKIDSLFVEEGSYVEKGQKLARLETQEIAARLSQAEGAYNAAQAQVRQAEDSVPLTSQQVETAIEQAGARVAQAEVGVQDAGQSLERAAALYESGAASAKSLDDAKNNYELSQNKLREARGALDQALAARLKVQVAQSQYEAALGQSKQAGGAVEEARTYLGNTLLIAPLSGYITRKNLEEGEMVNAGTPVLEITDIRNTYVKVFISETKIGRVHLDQEAEITVASFPDRVFPGKVVWINNAGDFAVRKAVSEQDEHDLRSFEVKIDLPNPGLVLKTGMTARVRLLEEAN